MKFENGDLTYTHLGPGHFGMAISGEYPNGERVIWSNGQERISKLDYNKPGSMYRAFVCTDLYVKMVE